MGMRTNCKSEDLSDILGDSTMEDTLKKAAETSMGTEISPKNAPKPHMHCCQCDIAMSLGIMKRSAEVTPASSTLVTKK